MRQNRPLLGILFMMAAVTMFPFMGKLVQLLSERYEPDQIIWARVTCQTVLMLVMFGPRRGFSLLATRHPVQQLGRGVAQFFATSLYFINVRFMPLAQATAISFTTPFLVTALAWPMLGERFGLQRLVTLIVGFMGVLIIIRPGSDVFQWAAVGIIASALSYGMYQVLTRRVSPDDSPETSSLYSPLPATIILSIVMLFRWKNPESWLDAALLAGPGVFGGIGHYFLARAMTYAPASVVAPFMYWQIVGATCLDFFVSAHLPDIYTYIGASVLIAAGIYMGWQETRAKPDAATPEKQPAGSG
ncbi:MAG: DMT family transporter [Hyphomicrobiaceae bacterium]